MRIAKAQKQINDALNIRNKSITNHFHDLSLNSKILIWKKKLSNRSSKWIESFNFLNMENEICKIDMLYDLIEFRSTTVKPYYRISIRVNKDTTVASNDKQIFSNEEKSPNDQKKATDQSPKLHDTGINAVTPSAIIPNAVIFSADASNAAAPDVFSRAESEEISQSSPIKRGRGRFRKQSIIRLKNQSNLSIFLSNESDSSVSSPRTPYAESKKKNQWIIE